MESKDTINNTEVEEHNINKRQEQKEADVDTEQEKEDMRNRIRGCLYAALIGDALSMPVHWYYQPQHIVDHFGKITDFEAPKVHHPSSIMNLSNTGGHGRGSNKGTLIGEVILHGKRKFWGPPGVHYHQGMKAGENTLNALCLRVLIRTINNSKGKYDADKFLEDYISFMTTPDTHNDTYAESFHRDFFLNWSQGVAPRKCAGAEQHNSKQIGAFVMLPATVCAHYFDRELAINKSLEHLGLTHTSKELAGYAALYAGTLWDLLNKKKDARTAALDINKQLNLGLDAFWNPRRPVNDTQVVGGTYSSACYIDGAFASMTYLMGKYHDSVEECLISNTNCGGENAHRGAALGALMGASAGVQAIPQRWLKKLAASKEIQEEVDAFVDAIMANNST